MGSAIPTSAARVRPRGRRAAWLVFVSAVAVATGACARRHDRSPQARRAPAADSSARATTKRDRAPVDSPAVFRRQIDTTIPGRWVNAKEIPAVLVPGPLGSWDDFQVGSPVVLEEPGSGYAMWYRGCHLQGVEYGCGVGHARSRDGIAWERSPDPVFVPPDSFEREHLDAIAVAKNPDGYVLWYSVSSTFSSGHHHATLHSARSRDGLTWTPQEGTVYAAVSQGVRLTPSALWRDGRFHLWLIDSRSAIDPGTGHFPEMPADGDDVLLHFVSADGVRLEPGGSAPLQPLKLDRVPVSIALEPSGGFRALVYEQHPRGSDPQGVAVLRSSDGSSWERAGAEAMALPARDLDNHGVPAGVVGVTAPHGLLAWFVVRGDRGGEAIRAAFYKKT
jgi:hypothetical protein